MKISRETRSDWLSVSLMDVMIVGLWLYNWYGPRHGKTFGTVFLLGGALMILARIMPGVRRRAFASIEQKIAEGQAKQIVKKEL